MRADLAETPSFSSFFHRGDLLRSSTGVSEGSKMNGTKILGVLPSSKVLAA